MPTAAWIGLAVEDQDRVRHRPAADAHQRRIEPDDEAIDIHQERTRQRVAEFPAVSSEQEFRPDQKRDHHKGDLENGRRGEGRDHAADQHADRHRQRPLPQNLDRQIALLAMRAKRADRGRDDDRQRGSDAKLHAHVVGHLHHPENFIENRNDHAAAADTEQSGQQSGDKRAGDDQARRAWQARSQEFRTTSKAAPKNVTPRMSGRFGVRHIRRRVHNQRQRVAQDTDAGIRLDSMGRQMPPEGARAGHRAEETRAYAA